MSIAVLMRTEQELRTVDGVTSLHGEDGWVLDYSGRKSPLKNESFAVRRLYSDQVDQELRKTLAKNRQKLARLKRPLEAFQALNRDDLFDPYVDTDTLLNTLIKNYGWDPHHPFELPTSELQRKVRLELRASELHLAASTEITKHLRKVRLVIWARKDQVSGAPPKLALVLGLLCPDNDLEAAFYAFAALKEILVCPCCKNVFRPSRQDQDYCSIKCRETYRKRRFRAKGGK